MLIYTSPHEYYLLSPRMWRFASNTFYDIHGMLCANFIASYWHMLISWHDSNKKKPHHKTRTSQVTDWGRDKMDAISQTSFSNAFSWMKMLEFRLRNHWNLFARFEVTISQHWFSWWLGADQATSHYLSQWWVVYWRIYASLGLNELTPLVVNPEYSDESRSIPLLLITWLLASPGHHQIWYLLCWIRRSFSSMWKNANNLHRLEVGNW